MDLYVDGINTFDRWFTECIAICVNKFIGPDDYVWNINDCEVWRDLYDKGFSTEDAVRKTFQEN